MELFLATASAAGADELTSGAAFIQKLIQGGWTMFFLLLVSIAGVGFAIERFINLRRGTILPEALLKRADGLWRSGKRDELMKLTEKDRSTLGKMVYEVARYRSRGAETAERLAGDVAARDLRRHLQRAYPLAVVATLSPLLGLLGTVIGMIGAFDSVATAGSMGDASILGGDISKALITTGAGLSVAIPALALYHFFKVRTGILGIELEETAGELVNDWFGDENKLGTGNLGLGQKQKPLAVPAANVAPTPAPIPSSKSQAPN
jgi:biopolymer transport protein ExbB